jgi:HlyD family secretion protein
MAVFGSAVLIIAALWKEHVAAPSMIGQAEPVLSNVSAHQGGMLIQLNVNRFQRVKAGEPIGVVMIADPKVVQSTLAVLRSEVELLRSNLDPIAKQQRNAVDYIQLRIDWMRQRVALAGTRVNLQLAESELRRTEELFKEKVASQSTLDMARAAHDSLLRESEELTRLVEEGEKSLKELSPDNSPDISKISDDPMRAAMALNEAKLRQAEAELSPLTLYAPIDGIVTTIFNRPGEAVLAGKPVVSIATLKPIRIVGYLKAPVLDEAKPGMRVEVRTRGFRRESGPAQIMEIGAQLEAVPAPLQSSLKLASVEMGLPVEISIPSNLDIRPGELVDISLLPATN